MNITRQDIFKAGYITSLAVHDHFDEVARELDKLYLHPGIPADKKEDIFQLSVQASRLHASQEKVSEILGIVKFAVALDSLTGWIMSLPLDDEVKS